MAIADLARELRLTTSSVLHSIREAVEDGTIIRQDGHYSLSNTGHIKAMLIDGMERSLAVLEEHAAFWQGHDMSGIPETLQARIGELQGGNVVIDGPADLLKSQANFVAAVVEAREIWGVSPIIAPGYAEMILELLDRGAKVHLILTREVVSKIDPYKLADCRAMPNFDLKIIDSCKVAFTVADDCLFLGLFKPNGKYDTDSDLVCCGPTAARWGRDLWQFYNK
jgi:predicted transcriptional regulator